MRGGLYLIYKGYTGYEENEPSLFSYVEKENKDEIISIYNKNKDDLIEPRIIEARTLQTAFKIYKKMKR